MAVVHVAAAAAALGDGDGELRLPSYGMAAAWQAHSSILARVRIFNTGFSISLSKVESDAPFLGLLHANLAY